MSVAFLQRISVAFMALVILFLGSCRNNWSRGSQPLFVAGRGSPMAANRGGFGLCSRLTTSAGCRTCRHEQSPFRVEPRSEYWAFSSRRHFSQYLHSRKRRARPPRRPAPPAASRPKRDDSNDGTGQVERKPQTSRATRRLLTYDVTMWMAPALHHEVERNCHAQVDHGRRYFTADFNGTMKILVRTARWRTSTQGHLEKATTTCKRNCLHVVRQHGHRHRHFGSGPTIRRPRHSPTCRNGDDAG